VRRFQEFNAGRLGFSNRPRRTSIVFTNRIDKKIFDIASNIAKFSCDPPIEALEDINFAMNEVTVSQRHNLNDYN
jgi:NAD+ kinase